MAYSITYNWPSDGITLWSDVMTNSIAYSSPVYPAAGYTTVSNFWVVENESAAFEAETSITAILHVIPVLWTVYDTTDMRGVHE